MFTLFQIMTLESWSMGIVRPVMQVFPFAWIFFVLFILVATFTMLNLFIGVIVETMQTLHARSVESGDEPESNAEQIMHPILAKELHELRVELQEIKNRLKDSLK